jgi:predicted RNA-binding protein with PIN domain
MDTRWIIIDGYSLMHRDPEFAERKGNLASARQRLVRKIEEVAGSLAERITIVFDGTGKGSGEGYEAPAIEVVFSPGDKTADTVIERMVHDAAVPEEVLVVTSDLLERQTVAAARAQSMSCGDFLDLMSRHTRHAKRQARPSQGKAPGATLGDYFPPGTTQR